MKLFDKQFQEYVIHQNTHKYGYTITEKLNVTAQIWLRKGNVFGKQKTQRESDAKGDDKGCNMRTNSHKPKIEYLLVKDKIVADKIQKEI